MDQYFLRERALAMAIDYYGADLVESDMVVETAEGFADFLRGPDELLEMGEAATDPMAPQAGTDLSQFGFSMALMLLKDGQKLQRLGWNGKGMFIYLRRGSLDMARVHGDLVNGIPRSLFSSGDKGTVTRLPNISMHVAGGATVDGWLASQADMLAEDWQTVRD